MPSLETSNRVDWLEDKVKMLIRERGQMISTNNIYVDEDMGYILTELLKNIKGIRTFRGAADPDIFGIILNNEDGTDIYIWPNQRGTGVKANPTQP